MLKAENLGTRTPAAGNVKVRIGRGINRSTTNRFRGLMDDFRIYDRALTDNEVSTVYGRETVTLPGSYWKSVVI